MAHYEKRCSASGVEPDRSGERLSRAEPLTLPYWGGIGYGRRLGDTAETASEESNLGESRSCSQTEPYLKGRSSSSSKRSAIDTTLIDLKAMQVGYIAPSLRVQATTTSEPVTIPRSAYMSESVDSTSLWSASQ